MDRDSREELWTFYNIFPYPIWTPRYRFRIFRILICYVVHAVFWKLDIRITQLIKMVLILYLPELLGRLDGARMLSPRGGGGRRRYNPKIWVGECGTQTNIGDFPNSISDPKFDTLFQTRPLPDFVCVNSWEGLRIWDVNQIVKSHFLRRWKTIKTGSFFLKTYPIPDQSVQTLPYFKTKWSKSIPYFRPQRLKNHNLWRRTPLVDGRGHPLRGTKI